MAAVGDVTCTAGPLTDEEAAALPRPPMVQLSSTAQLLRFRQRQIEFVFGARRRLGPVFGLHTMNIPAAVTGVSEDVRSLFTAKPEDAPSLAARSALRPYLGRDSVLTALGKRHMRQRKLLLPSFHGDAIDRFMRLIVEAAEREIDRWPLHREFALAPRMQALTLDVIMAGLFGAEGLSRRGTPERRLRAIARQCLRVEATAPIQILELANVRRSEPFRLLKLLGSMADREFFALIEERRRAEDLDRRHDILSLLVQARTEDGESLTNEELRIELLTLLLAGHETTANSLAWAWERLTRNPAALERLREAVRTDTDAEPVIEQTIMETLRCRPTVPLIGRRVKRPWRLGGFYAVPATTPVMISILLLHHQEDVYSEPFEFRPERWIDRKPGTYEWLGFGGGIRRCLGSALAMAEQRAVLRAMATRLDVEAADPIPERAMHRNVTMVPARGARVVIRSRRTAA